MILPNYWYEGNVNIAPWTNGDLLLFRLQFIDGQINENFTGIKRASSPTYRAVRSFFLGNKICEWPITICTAEGEHIRSQVIWTAGGEV